MRDLFTHFQAVALCAAVGCAVGATAAAPVAANRMADQPMAIAALESKSGSHATGTVEFLESKDAIIVRANVQGLAGGPGQHGIHIHQNGDCSAADATSAGDHFNPLNKAHGGPHQRDRHVGDLGNVEVDKEGNGYLSLNLNVSDSERSVWKQIVGKSVVLHAAKDDLTSQPAGDSGARIACGVIRRVSVSVP